MKRLIIIILALVLPPILSGNTYVRKPVHPYTLNLQIQPNKFSGELHNYFNQLVRTGFNGGMLVAHKGQVIFKKVHGWRHFHQRDSLTLPTAFQLASVSKQFTALAIMRLKEQGLLAYSDKLRDYIPGWPYEHPVTIRQLLTHRSGMTEYRYFCDEVTSGDSLLTNQRVIDLIKQHKPTPYGRPGQRFDYRNTNYILLAHIVEQVSGMSFPEFLNTHFFKPLDMHQTFVMQPEQPPHDSTYTTGYLYPWRKAYSTYFDGVYGDKGIYTTLEDLFKWDRALYTNRIVSQQTLHDAFAAGSPGRRGSRNYGFGFRLREFPNGTRIAYHAGWWRGHKTLHVRIPETASTIIILSNELHHGFINTYPRLVQLLSQDSDPEPLQRGLL